MCHKFEFPFQNQSNGVMMIQFYRGIDFLSLTSELHWLWV